MAVITCSLGDLSGLRPVYNRPEGPGNRQSAHAKPNEKARQSCRAFPIGYLEKRLRRLFLDALFGTGLFGRLGTAARALGESGLDFLDRFGLGHALDCRNLERQPVKRSFI